MAKCANCGKYNDPFEWPEAEAMNYRPNLCYACYCEECQAESDAEEEADNFDPNTEYGMSEVKPNPEDDDTPVLDTDETDNQELEETNATESEPLSDEAQSIRNIQRMLFG